MEQLMNPPRPSLGDGAMSLPIRPAKEDPASGRSVWGSVSGATRSCLQRLRLPVDSDTCRRGRRASLVWSSDTCQQSGVVHPLPLPDITYTSADNHGTSSLEAVRAALVQDDCCQTVSTGDGQAPTLQDMNSKPTKWSTAVPAFTPYTRGERPTGPDEISTYYRQAPSADHRSEHPRISAGGSQAAISDRKGIPHQIHPALFHVFPEHDRKASIATTINSPSVSDSDLSTNRWSRWSISTGLTTPSEVSPTRAYTKGFRPASGTSSGFNSAAASRRSSIAANVASPANAKHRPWLPSDTPETPNLRDHPVPALPDIYSPQPTSVQQLPAASSSLGGDAAQSLPPRRPVAAAEKRPQSLPTDITPRAVSRNWGASLASHDASSKEVQGPMAQTEVRASSSHPETSTSTSRGTPSSPADSITNPLADADLGGSWAMRSVLILDDFGETAPGPEEAVAVSTLASNPSVVPFVPLNGRPQLAEAGDIHMPNQDDDLDSETSTSHSADVSRSQSLVTQATSMDDLTDLERLLRRELSDSDDSLSEMTSHTDESLFEAWSAKGLNSLLICTLMNFKDDVLARVVGRVNAILQSRGGQTQHGNAGGSTTGASPSSLPNSTPASNFGSEQHGSGGRKRQLDGDDSDGAGRDGDDQGKRQKPNATTKVKPAPRPRELACPFCKRYPDMQWECSQRGWEEVRRIKEHIYRRHKLYFCPRCHSSFKNEQLLEEHFRGDDRCELKDGPVSLIGMTPSQEVLLKSRKRPNNGPLPEVEKWQVMFQILFPEASQEDAPCPYTDSGTGNLGVFTEALIQDVPSRVTKELCELPGIMMGWQNYIGQAQLEQIISKSIREAITENFPPELRPVERPTGPATTDEPATCETLASECYPKSSGEPYTRGGGKMPDILAATGAQHPYLGDVASTLPPTGSYGAPQRPLVISPEDTPAHDDDQWQQQQWDDWPAADLYHSFVTDMAEPKRFRRPAQMAPSYHNPNGKELAASTAELVASGSLGTAPYLVTSLSDFQGINRDHNHDPFALEYTMDFHSHSHTNSNNNNNMTFHMPRESIAPDELPAADEVWQHEPQPFGGGEYKMEPGCQTRMGRGRWPS